MVHSIARIATVTLLTGAFVRVISGCATGVTQVDDGTGGGGGGGGSDPDAGGGTPGKDSGGGTPGKDSGGGPTCNNTLCSGKCIDTKTDVSNCGSCGNACGGGSGSWSCVAGACVPVCTGSDVACGATCYDLTATDTHCGDCKTDCTASGGACCSSACADLQTDGNNCGACGTSCNGGACTNGACCSKPPTGSCGTSPCSTNPNGLFPGCDGKGCVSAVINKDPFCSFDWDSFCVQEVDLYCKPYKCGC